MKRNPYSVVLLDEIEKAHPDIFNILLQVFEDGHLTDGLGNRVNFKNTIIIMTSNIGARFIQKKSSMGFQSADAGTIDKSVSDMVLGEVKRTFNPEFINRIDEIIVFEALADDDLRRIMGLLVTQLNENLVDRKLKIALTPEVIDWIIEVTCKDRSYGARPLRRAIQRYVEDPLSEELIRGHLRGGEIEVYLDAGAARLPACRRARSGPQARLNLVIGHLELVIGNWSARNPIQSDTRCPMTRFRARPNGPLRQSKIASMSIALRSLAVAALSLVAAAPPASRAGPPAAAAQASRPCRRSPSAAPRPRRARSRRPAPAPSSSSSRPASKRRATRRSSSRRPTSITSS